jgi:hypothetical protein
VKGCKVGFDSYYPVRFGYLNLSTIWRGLKVTLKIFLVLKKESLRVLFSGVDPDGIHPLSRDTRQGRVVEIP